MPTVTISDETFRKLQALATPFTDTPDTVIRALADAALDRQGVGEMPRRNGVGHGVASVARLDPDAHDNLAHTRVLSATVGGQAIHRPKWNGILDHMHVIARRELGSYDAVRSATGANVREGRYEENGFRYLEAADLSVQGVDANLAWSHSLGLARGINVDIEVRFEWRQKEGAARPGEVATLAWAPSLGAARS